jgi:hypothetical protein
MESIDSISLLLTKSEMTDRCVVLINNGNACQCPDGKQINDFLADRIVEGTGGIVNRKLESWIPQNIFDYEFWGSNLKRDKIEPISNKLQKHRKNPATSRREKVSYS